MKREIKFRGQAIGQNGNWIYGNCLMQISSGSYLANNIAPSKSNEHNYAGVVNVGQYTGIKDKNGKEIYEGDIIRVDSVSEWFRGIGNVEFLEKGGCWYVDGNVEGSLSDCIYSGRVEVVGNIYDNPELLKEV